MACYRHPQHQVSIICCANHYCERKLCPECIQQHQVHTSDLYSINQFQLKLQKYLELPKDEEDEYLLIKNMFESRVKQFQVDLNTLVKSINNILNLIGKEIQNSKNLFLNTIKEFSYTDIKLLVDRCIGNQIIQWRSLQNSCLEHINKINQWLNKELPNLKQFCQESGVKLIQLRKNTYPTQQRTIQSFKWDFQQSRRLRTSYQIQYLQGNTIRYLRDGEIIRMYIQLEKNYDFKKLELTPLEQILYLQIENRKAIWKGEILPDVGGDYSEYGKKQHQWKELTKNYQSNAQVYEIGRYDDDQRIGAWKYIHNFQTIGGGDYNNKNQKVGQWIEICEEFHNQRQVTYVGQYEKGKKIGQWDIYCIDEYGDSITIGGGIYIIQRHWEEDCQSKKNGEWIELSEHFNLFCQVVYIGRYINGQKVGRWDTKFIKVGNKQGQTIGGGVYNQMSLESNEVVIGKKNGLWIDLGDEFQCSNQITYSGSYKNGIKVGQWKTILRENGDERIAQTKSRGSYIETTACLWDVVSSCKDGEWTEISSVCHQMIYKGYYKVGLKNGKWDIFFRNVKINQNDENYYVDSIKYGDWIELGDRLESLNSVAYCGQYNNNYKINKWIIKYREDNDCLWSEIGGGEYDSEVNEYGIVVNSFKKGEWKELSENFWNKSQVLHLGEYRMGKKVGRWDILWRGKAKEDFVQIGGGIYSNENICFSLKKEKWVELDDCFWNEFKVIWAGQYNNGLKIGNWELQLKKEGEAEFEYLGGGNYDLEKEGVKVGLWKEKNEGFNFFSQVIYEGQYKEGKKWGKWNIKFREPQSVDFKEIGGGNYNNSSLKNGKWIELGDGFEYNKQIIHIGEYAQNKKIGRWEIKFIGKQFIGGGLYDEIEGTKFGFWILPSENKTILEGHYEKGTKVGKWMEKNQEEKTVKEIDYHK